MSEDLTQIQGADDRQLAQKRSLVRLQPPTEVPGYDVDRFLGAGAYGEVWVAVDRNTSRQVAIKFYTHRGGVDWSLLNREVEKLLFFATDRYVVQLMKVGWDADPPYYVMEFMEAGSLEDRLQAGPLPVSEAVKLFRGVAVGLVHAHGRGVLHCDLKPANVLLDQDGEPRLADFGQSRLSHEQTPALGTLYYMAPEQADLKAVPDARWDVYALGALLYRMLVGEPPFRTPEMSQRLEAEESLEDRLTLYRKLIRQAPKPTGHRRVSGVDSSLAELIDRCLTVDPRKRYPNPQAIVDALQIRDMRRSRRPMLVLGALGPALLLLVMGLFAWASFDKAISDSTEALTHRALESNRFAARFVAETAARDIDRRWRILETEQISLQNLLAQVEERIRNLEPDTPAWHEAIAPLQAWLDKRYCRYNTGETLASSWFITDQRGYSLARSPRPQADSDTVGMRFAHRDYFHGLGEEFEASDPRIELIEPIQEPYRSQVFQSNASNRRMVAFSVPVFRESDGEGESQVIGVIAITVELGSFGEMSGGGSDANGDSRQVAVLVDLRSSRAGPPGLILQHPSLEFEGDPAAVAPQDGALRAYCQAVAARGPGDPQPRLEPSTPGAVTRPLPTIRLPDAELARVMDLSAQARGQRSVTSDDYRDPFSAEDPETYGGRWLAAFEPVVIDGRSGSSRSIDWLAIVQEEYDEATRPVESLQSSLLWRGVLALGVLVCVLTGLWGFVMWLLNDSARSGLLGGFRARAGLTTEPGLSQRSSGATPMSQTPGSSRASSITPGNRP
jgi:serine/threonine protein kinase